jgi:pimeloyl-ACP methyl ester carboxylesterase
MTTTHEFDVEGRHLVALSLNPEAAGGPIVLLHGFTASARLFLWPEVAFLREHGPCYALSLPGHYPATFPPDFDARLLTAETVARVLTTAIRQLLGDQQRFTLIGVSLGACTALAIAAHCPEMVSRLICVSGAAEGKKVRGSVRVGLWLARQGAFGRAIDKGTFKILQSPKRYPNLWRRCWGNPRAFDTWPGREAFLEGSLADFVHLDLDAMVAWHRAFYKFDLIPILPRITAPALVLSGDDDPLAPPEQSRLIAGKVHNAELVTFKNAGHVIPLECPAEFRHVTDEWLRKTA